VGPEVTRTREEEIETFNSIRTREQAVSQEKRTVQEKRSECMESIRRLQGEIDGLQKEEAELGTAWVEIEAKKRDLIETMSHEEQLDFMYEAGLAAASKRPRLG
jgi:predicted  nucleic acid-binding Zn-ribbon protein